MNRIVAWLTLILLVGAVVAAPAPQRIVIETVRAPGAGQEAAFRAGDVLVAWHRGAAAVYADAQGTFGSPFDLDAIETEQAPRGPVTIGLLRDGESLTVTAPVADWGLSARPRLAPERLERYEKGRELLTGDDPAPGRELWRELVAELSAEGRAADACWLLTQLTGFSTGPESADEIWNEAIALAEARGTSALVAAVRSARAQNLFEAGRRAPGVEAFERAIAAQAELPDHELRTANLHQGLAILAIRSGDVETAETNFRQAWEVRSREAPGSLAHASSVNGLGGVAWEKGDLATAESRYREALGIRRAVAPESDHVAGSRLNLGNVLRDQGKLGEAEDQYRQALIFYEATAPGGPDVAGSLGNLATVAHARGDLDGADALYQRVLEIWETLDPGGLRVAWTYNNLGNVAASRGDLKSAEEHQLRSLEIKERLVPESRDLASTLINLGGITAQRGDFDRAAAYLERALVTERELAPGSITLARTLNNLGMVALDQRRLEEAEAYFEESLAIKSTLAPDTVDEASTIANLGNVAYVHGDLALAEELFERAAAQLERIAPDYPGTAGQLSNAGLIAAMRGDLGKGEDLLRRGLRVLERVAPRSQGMATALLNLARVAKDRGDLATAEQLTVSAVEIWREQAPDTLDTANGIAALGHLLKYRGDLVGAEARYREALAIRRAVAPESYDVAGSLGSLGEIAHRSGDLEDAERLYRESLALNEKVGHGGMAVAANLTNLGLIAQERGDLESGRVYLERAMELFVEQSPGGLQVAETHNHLGDVAFLSGDLESAGEHHRQALSILEAVATGSLEHAVTLYSLARLDRELGRPTEAIVWFEAAIDALETQIGHLGGSQEARASFRAEYLHFYREYQELLLEQGREDEAFWVLERSRARSLLAMLAERDLVLGDVPEELERRRRLANGEYDRLLESLGELSTIDDAEEIERLRGELREVTRARERLDGEIRDLSPRLAALRHPEPLDSAGARRALDEGTVVLSYSVGAEVTHLFVLTADGPLEAVTLSVGEERLREEVALLRRRITRTRLATHELARLWAQAEELYALLIAPAEARVAGARRLLIVPDGPLFLLPFAMLRQADAGPDDADGAGRFLVERAPIHLIASVTLYDEIRRQGHGDAETPTRLVAFGDPSYPRAETDAAHPAGDPAVRSLADRGQTFEALPASRAEVEAIAQIYPEAAETYLGEAATEERAKSVGRDTRYVHFATHGLLDEDFPLDSALALTIPSEPGEGQDNGLLQAWEILQQVRLDADLVTLSACETALGREVAGEGLVGLTRAFQYAGARSILASLWQVGDEATAGLMNRFYADLKAGHTKDEALRSAQLELLEAGPDHSHPFYWAAFELVGDWS